MAKWILGGKPAPSPELVKEIHVEPPAFDKAREFLTNGCTKQQAEQARGRIADLGADGTLSAAEVEALMELCDQKGV